MDHKGRVRRLQDALSQNRLDYLVVSHLPNIRYLSGFTGSSAVMIVGETAAVLFTDGRYAAQARAEVNSAKTVISRKNPLLSAADWLTTKRKSTKANNASMLGMEGESLTVGAQSRLRKALPAGFRLKIAPLLIEAQRTIKDEDEVQRIRAAIKLGAQLFDTAVNNIRPGVRESSVAAEMEYAAHRAGAQGMSFETIIASGARSALPHARASAQSIPAQGFVVCDFGVILTGYCSDMTRTVHVGKIPDDSRRVYEAVRKAQQAGVEAVRPGVTAGEVDQAARKILVTAGLGRYFSHSTGHGVGVEIHEAPRVAAGQKDVLRPGMVITIEPGAYIPGKLGVRIEDMVLVTQRGCEVLTPTGKDLLVL